MDLLYQSIALTAFCINLILAVFVLRQNLRRRLNQIFAVFLIGMALWALANYITWQPLSLSQAVFWTKFAYLMFPVVTVSFYHFVNLYIGNLHFFWRPLLAYLGILIVALLLPTDLLIKSVTFAWAGVSPVLGSYITFYLVLYYGILIISIIRLLINFRRLDSSREKRRYTYIVTGATVFVLGMLLNTLSAAGIEVYPVGIFCNIVFSLLCAYTILRYQLLDISVFLRKGAPYVLVSVLAAGSYIALFYLAYNFISGIWTVSFWVNIVFIFVLALGFQPTLRWAQSVVDRWFYRERYDYLNALERLAEETTSITDLNSIAGSLVKTITRAMSCSKVTVLLPDNEGQKFSAVRFPDHPVNNLVLSRDSGLVWYLNLKKCLITRQEIGTLPQLSALSDFERQMLEELEAQLFIPLVTSDGLRGILILGAKSGDAEYLKDEIQLLRVVANQMASIIDNARLYELERKMRLELEKTDKARTDFINALVHEIKTPITAMMASCDLLTEELASSPGVINELTDNLNVSISNLNRRVSEFANYARLQNTEIKINLQKVHMHQLIQRVELSLSGLLHSRGQSLHCDLSALSDTVKADPERVIQILMNLITNASKYGQPDKTIVLKTYNINNSLVTDILDTAVPLSIEDQAQLFKPYNLAARKESGGMGLGLFICKKLVDLHQGLIWVETSETGNQFKFSLPLSSEKEETL